MIQKSESAIETKDFVKRASQFVEMTEKGISKQQISKLTGSGKGLIEDFIRTFQDMKKMRMDLTSEKFNYHFLKLRKANLLLCSQF